jgi:CRP/FNR family cyclic AMP-dependent transcriptional regulator
MHKDVNPDPIDNAQLAGALRRVSLFADMNPADLEQLASSCELARVTTGGRIFEATQPGGHLYIVISGRVRIFNSSAQGRSKTVAYLDSGDFFGELSFIDQESRSASAEALEPCVFATINAERYREWILARPEVAWALLKSLSARLRQAKREIQALSFNNALGRVAQILLDLAGHYGEKTDDGLSIIRSFKQRELADMAGTAREVVSRALSRFKRIGCVKLSGDRITLLNEDKLRGLIS